MGTVTAKLNNDDDQKLLDICRALHIDKSDALRMSVRQAWLALQLNYTFVERAGGHPKFLLNFGDQDASKRPARKEKIASYLEDKVRKRKASSNKLPPNEYPTK